MKCVFTMKDPEIIVLSGQGVVGQRLMCGWYLCISVLVLGCSIGIPFLLYQNQELSERITQLEYRFNNLVDQDVIELPEDQSEEFQSTSTEYTYHDRRKRQANNVMVVPPAKPTVSEGLRLYENWQTKDNQKKDPQSAEITLIEDSFRANVSKITFAPEIIYSQKIRNLPFQQAKGQIIQRKGRVFQTSNTLEYPKTTPKPDSILIPTWEQITSYDGTTLSPKITHMEEVESQTNRRKLRKRPRKPMKKHLRSGRPVELLDNNKPVFGGFSPVSAALYYPNANMTRHTNHYLGNHRVRNKGRKFVHWKHASWMNKLGMAVDYSLHRGDIQVTEPGLYFIFAQVQYSDMRDLNGFQIDVNGDLVTNCVAMTTTQPGNLVKSNTCFTGTLVYLHATDRVGLRDLEHHRVSLHKEGHTYIGLIHLF